MLRSLHAGDQIVGLLRGVQAIGGVLGGLVVGTWAKHLTARTLTVGGLAAFGLLSLLTWNSPAITTETWWYVGLFIAVGLPATALVTGLLTGTQRASPRRVLGRVLSLIQVAQALGQGTGILLAGLLSGTVSLTVLLNVQASCYLACAVVAVMGFAPIARRTEDLTAEGDRAADFGVGLEERVERRDESPDPVTVERTAGRHADRPVGAPPAPERLGKQRPEVR